MVFQREAYDPSSDAGRTTLAHELTHVVQQRSGPVDGTSAGGGIKVSDPSDRFEQEAAANAERVMAAPAPAPAAAGSALQRSTDAPESVAAVQRHEADADEPELAAQREAEAPADEVEDEVPAE